MGDFGGLTWSFIGWRLEIARRTASLSLRQEGLYRLKAVKRIPLSNKHVNQLFQLFYTDFVRDALTMKTSFLRDVQNGTAYRACNQIDEEIRAGIEQ